MIKPPQTPPMLFTQSRRLRLLEVKRSAIQCRKYANLAHVDPAQMADNPIALVDNRCKAWLDSVGFKASGFHSGPEQGAIQGLPFGYEERPNVDANSIVNELVARIAEHWHKARGAKRDGIDIGSFVKSERMKSAPVIVNRLMCIIDVPAHAP